MQIYADIFNRSSDAVQYLISFKKPKQIIDRYRFNVELVCHLPTSMHASGEGHQCYIFKRMCEGRASKSRASTTRRCYKLRHCRQEVRNVCKDSNTLKKVDGIACDALFYKAFLLCRSGRGSMSKYVSEEVDKFYKTKPKRSRKQVQLFCPG